MQDSKSDGDANVRCLTISAKLHGAEKCNVSDVTLRTFQYTRIIFYYGNIKGSFMVSLFNFILTVTRGKQFLHIYKSCFDHQALACQNIRLQQSTMNYRTLEQTIGVCLDYIC